MIGNRLGITIQFKNLVKPQHPAITGKLFIHPTCRYYPIIGAIAPRNIGNIKLTEHLWKSMVLLNTFPKIIRKSYIVPALKIQESILLEIKLIFKCDCPVSPVK